MLPIMLERRDILLHPPSHDRHLMTVATKDTQAAKSEQHPGRSMVVGRNCAGDGGLGCCAVRLVLLVPNGSLARRRTKLLVIAPNYSVVSVLRSKRTT